MNISTANLTKSTPRLWRAIGNGVMFAALGVQPLISDAGTDIMTARVKFWTSFAISLTAGLIKGFTMMVGEDTPLSDNNINTAQEG